MMIYNSIFITVKIPIVKKNNKYKFYSNSITNKEGSLVLDRYESGH